jgi:hypothetical protein
LHILAYLKTTPTMGLFFTAHGTHPGTLVGYSDANFAANCDNRRSITAYCFTQNGATVAWKSNLQDTVALSTTESEYMAASAAGTTALWLAKLRGDFGYDETACINVLSTDIKDRQALGPEHNKIKSCPLVYCDCVLQYTSL